MTIMPCQCKYGTTYPIRVNHGGSWGIRRTLLSEQYQNENVLYAGLNEEPNVLVQFRKVGDPNAALRADKIGSYDEVRLDFYEMTTQKHIGWLKNDEGIAKLTRTEDYVADERNYRFFYV